MEALWRIEMLGRLQAVNEGRAVSRFRSQQTALLLAYLAYYPHRCHPREALTELLWPGCEAAAGRLSLRVALASLRRQLEPPGVPRGAVLIATHAAVQLNPNTCTTDVARFETALQSASRMGGGPEQIAALAGAIELYRGELLPGSYDAWVLQERLRLSEAYLRALLQLIGLLEQVGELPRAVHYARLAVSGDPLSEEAHFHLIRLLAATGQPGAALRQYQALRELLSRELGIEPGPETRALIGGIPPGGGCKAKGATTVASRHPSRSAARTIALPGCPPPDEAPTHRGNLPLQLTRFFGREDEITRLCEMLMGQTPGASRQAPVSGSDLSLAAASDVNRDLCRTGVWRLASGDCRLVTLTGPGGSGKTRLAVELARRVRAASRDAVWFVPLADLADPRLIPDKVLEALPQPREPGVELVEQVVRNLSREPTLLVLDNFEHLVQEGASFVLMLLQRLELLKVLVTSRQRLGLAGEREFPVLPLPVPAAVDSDPWLVVRSGPTGAVPLTANHQPLTTVPSVRLFVDRAQAVRADFQVTAGNAAAVAALCARLEGLPLAIELAAARIGVLTPAQMLARLAERFELLVSRRRDLAARHRTLRAALDWSYQLLSPELQRFFVQLSVFRSGFTLEAAEAVCGGEAGVQAFRRSGVQDRTGASGPSDPSEPERLNARTSERLNAALEYLEQLRECSLVQAGEAQSAQGLEAGLSERLNARTPERLTPEIRFRLLETLREYAAEQLAPNEPTDLAARHAAYFMALAEQAAPELDGPAQREWLDRLEREQDNLRAALDWAEASGEAETGLRLLAAAAPFWWVRGYYLEGRERLPRLLALAGAERRTPARARAVHAAWRMQDDPAVAYSLLEEALSLSRELGDRPGTAEALLALGNRAHCNGDPVTAWALMEEGLAICRELGHQPGIALGLSAEAQVASARGDRQLARALTEESLTISRELGDQRHTTYELLQLAELALGEGQLEQARAVLDECLTRFRELHDTIGAAAALRGLGELARLQGDLGTARSLHEEALAIYRHAGIQVCIARSLNDLGLVALQEGDWQRALTLCSESMNLFQAAGSKSGVAGCLEGLARLAACRRRPEGAVRLFGAAHALRQAIGIPLPPREQREHEQQLAALRECLGERSFAAAWEAGHALSWEQAAAAALEPR